MTSLSFTLCILEDLVFYIVGLQFGDIPGPFNITLIAL